MAAIATEINTYLTTKGIPPTQQWLQNFIPSIRLSTPLPALQKTAEFRLLGTDITTSLRTSSTTTLPAGVADPAIQELRIPGPIPVQILDIEDIGRSRWSQVEAIEMEQRGETRKGQEVIRVVPDAGDNSDPDPPTNLATQPAGRRKLLMQDAVGNKVYAFELESVRALAEDVAIGAKLILKDFVVVRGVMLLTARCTTVLGGRIDAWDKTWREDRQKVLREKAGLQEDAMGNA